MVKEEKYDINNIYIGFESKEEYSEFLEEYELWEDHVLLEKTKYEINCDDVKICVYKYLNTDNKLYIKSDGVVVNSCDETTGEERYHKITNILSLKDLLEKFKSSNRSDSQYRDYVIPIYEKVVSVLESSDTVNLKNINHNFGNICDIYTYIFDIITEDEYEDLFGCKMYDFKSGCRIKK